MAGELASAIALQGQPRNRPASVGPSEELIDNAFNRRRREEEAAKAKKAADDEKRLNEILKNTAFTKQFDNPYYNRKYQNDAARAMDDIIRTYSEGGENSFVVARNKLRELESIMSTYELADKNMSDARKAASEKPDEYAALFNPQRIGSKTHATMFDALNDPELAGREDEIAEAFESPSAMFMKEKVNGNDVGVAMFSLQNARTIDPFKKGEAALKDNSRYTELGEPIVIQNRNTQLKVVPTLLNKDYLKQVTLDIFADPSVANNAIINDFNAYKAEALKKDPSKNATWRQYEAERGDLRNVAVKASDNFYVEASKMTGTPYSVSDKLSAEKESDSGKNADKIIAGGGFNMDGTVFELPFTGVFQQERVVSIPKGATFITGPNSKPETVGTSNDIKATPVRIEWNPKKPMEGHIIYQSKFDPTGKELSKTKASDEFMAESTQESSTYTYRVPVTKATINNIASLGGTNTDTFVSKIIEKSAGGPVSEIEKWLENALGVSPSGMPGPGKKEAPQKMDAQGKSYGGSGTSLTKTQKDALSAFEAQLGRKPTETEKAKILEKYK